MEGCYYRVGRMCKTLNSEVLMKLLPAIKDVIIFHEMKWHLMIKNLNLEILIVKWYLWTESRFKLHILCCSVLTDHFTVSFITFKASSISLHITFLYPYKPLSINSICTSHVSPFPWKIFSSYKFLRKKLSFHIIWYILFKYHNPQTSYRNLKPIYKFASGLYPNSYW